MSEKDKPRMGFEVNMRSKLDNQQAEKTISKIQSLKSNAVETDPDSPFCIAVLGDFSGQGAGSPSDLKPAPIKARRFIDIDRDNIEEVMSGLDIKLDLKIADESIPLTIKELDDFHPDEIYDKVESFSKLRSLRRRLKSNKTFADAAAEIQGWVPEMQEKKPAEEKSTDEVNAQTIQASENLLDDILSVQQNQQPDASASDARQIDRLIKSIVAPYVEPATDPRQDEMIAMVDKATETHMRNILHHPDFQAMEAAWQSLYFLVKRLETGSKLKIRILDISKQELMSDLAVDDITSAALYKKFCDSSQGDIPWGLLLGNYSFSDSIDDILSLANIGVIAQQSNAPFIAAASEKLAGCESLALSPDYEDWNYTVTEGVKEVWQMLRQSPVAAYIGLALPRFLLRVPYGKKSRPIESFSFEEMPEEHCHDCYLWGNAAFIKAELLARNFKKNGWKMRPPEEYQTDKLPVHYYQQDGETLSKPVAEIFLTERGGELISTQGLMSLWSVKNMDAVRSADFRSINESASLISGRWPQ